MKLTLLWTVIASLLSLSSLSAEDAPFRIWTNTKNQELNAQLLSVDGDSISIKTRDGRVYDSVKLELFSAEDQAYVAEYKEKMAAAAKAAANAPKTEPVFAKAGKLIFAEDFDADATAGSWNMPHGSWEMSNGVLTASELAENNHAAVMKRAMPLTNAVIEFEVQLSEGAKQAAFGFDDNDHICRFQIMPNAFLVKKDDHDHEGPDEGVMLEQTKLDADEGEWLQVRLEIVDTHFLAAVNGETAYGSHELIASTKEKWGFVVGGGPVTFRNLRVWEATKADGFEDTVARLERRSS